MDQGSGLVRKRHRRGRRRRDKLRLALRVLVSLIGLAIAVGLSAGMIRVVERPVLPIKALAEQFPTATPPLYTPPPLEPVDSASEPE